MEGFDKGPGQHQGVVSGGGGGGGWRKSRPLFTFGHVTTRQGSGPALDLQCPLKSSKRESFSGEERARGRGERLFFNFFLVAMIKIPGKV